MSVPSLEGVGEEEGEVLEDLPEHRQQHRGGPDPQRRDRGNRSAAQVTSDAWRAAAAGTRAGAGRSRAGAAVSGLVGGGAVVPVVAGSASPSSRAETIERAVGRDTRGRR